MDTFLGAGNTWCDYLGVIVIYTLLFVCIRAPWPTIELNWRVNFRVLAICWFIMMFTGNYLFYLLGVMSFLPWFNNLLHTSLWIGIVLTWLYHGVHKHSLIEQFILFAGYSFIVKMAESMMLGSWMKESFYFFHGRYAYLIAMSIVDGFYPLISIFVLRIAKKFVRGVVID